jgi:G:T-mismatch repair DNA endonuclease (very short patch repair protein)
MTLGGKIPDIVNVNGKKQVIELLGTYWHGEKITGRTKEQEEDFLKSHYSKYGFDCLIVWESELDNPIQLNQRIQNFS